MFTSVEKLADPHSAISEMASGTDSSKHKLGNTETKTTDEMLWK